MAKSKPKPAAKQRKSAARSPAAETTTAGEIMSTEVLTIQVGVSVEEALKILFNHRITGMPVVDAKGKLVGVLSEFDILEQIAKEGGMSPAVFRMPATFSGRVDTISEKAGLSEVVDRFIGSRYRRLPVVDAGGKLRGIITRRDLMRVFFYRSRLA